MPRSLLIPARRVDARPRQAAALALWLAGALLAATALSGCGGGGKKAPAVPPPPTFTGPKYLQGTVGSLAVWRGFQPALVSGYGLVGGLPRTGSGDVPAFARQWLIQRMRQQGFGSANEGATSPSQALASGELAFVIIEGFVPPGAVKGTRFDLLVRTYPQTQTQSLEGGVLGPWDLAEGGANPALRHITPLAKSGGPIYINAFEADDDPKSQLETQRRGVVLSGGVVNKSRPIELLLNQASYNRARDISERINEVFGRPTDKRPIADPKTAQLIEINIPARHARRPEMLLALVSHLYTQRSMNFESDQAQTLANLLVANETYSADITYAWMALGKNAWPVLRRYYSHELMHVRLSALEAGAYNGDPLTLGDTTGTAARGRLLDLAHHALPAPRRRAAELMVYLRDNTRAHGALARLMDDPDRAVRIAAYESLAENGHPLVQRQVFGDRNDFKFILDLVPSEKPLIYVTQERIPRIAIFNPMLSFKMPLLAHLWDNRLMLRGEDPEGPMTAFYQGPYQERSRTYQVLPTAANLTFLMGHKRTYDSPTEGLDLTYSQVVNALYTLHQKGHIDCDFEIRRNPLVERVAKFRDDTIYQPRPETGGTGGEPGFRSLPEEIELEGDRSGTRERAETRRRDAPHPRADGDENAAAPETSLDEEASGPDGDGSDGAGLPEPLMLP